MGLDKQSRVLGHTILYVCGRLGDVKRLSVGSACLQHEVESNVRALG